MLRIETHDSAIEGLSHSTPGQIRTDTGPGLNRLPLAVGLQEHVCRDVAGSSTDSDVPLIGVSYLSRSCQASTLTPFFSQLFSAASNAREAWPLFATYDRAF